MKKLFFSLCLFPFLAIADTKCLVTKIADGDTFSCKDKYHNFIKVRIADIDAPEIGQFYGNKAKKALNRLIYRKNVHLTDERFDKYGRIVATVYVGNTNVNLEMIEKGFAWHYDRYSNNIQYMNAQHKAQQQKRGLWKDKEIIIKPEDWRHRYKPSNLE